MSNEIDKTLWVGNLSEKVTEDILYELFLQTGPLSRVKIATEKDGRKKSFAFVTFMHDVSVPYTISLMDGIQLCGKNLRLQTRPGSIHQQQQQQQQQQHQQQQNNYRHMHNPYQNNQPMPSNPYGTNQPIRNHHPQQQPPAHLHRSHTWHGADLDQVDRDRESRERDRDRQGNRDRDRSGSRRREEENGRGRRNDFDQGYSQNSPNNYNVEDFDAKRQRVLQKQDQMLSKYRHNEGRSSPQYQPWQSNPYQNRRGRY